VGVTGVAGPAAPPGRAASQGVAVSTTPEVLTPLAAFARWADGATPTSVNHQNTEPATTISFNLPPGKSLGDATTTITAAMHKIGVPASVTGSFQGTAQVFQQSLSSEPILILTALLAVYIVLGILYESLIHPLTILSTLPSAGVGAVAALMLRHLQFDIMGMIGVILLIGIVKKNAILMIDFALNAQRTQNITPRQAIYHACLLRFRPIMMTTMAAMFGALPLAIGIGDGAELRVPLGTAIVGGLMVSQLLTLFTTPVIYLYLDALTKWWKGHWERATTRACLIRIILGSVVLDAVIGATQHSLLFFFGFILLGLLVSFFRTALRYVLILWWKRQWRYHRNALLTLAILLVLSTTASLCVAFKRPIFMGIVLALWLTLYTTPAISIFLDRLKGWLRTQRKVA